MRTLRFAPLVRQFSTKRFLESHEWAMKTSSGAYRVGISDHAQDALGDVVFVELKSVGEKVAAGDEIGTVESVKSSNALYAPMSGKIVAVNKSVVDDPALVNQSAEDKGWMIEVEASDAKEFEKLMSLEDYKKTY